MGNNEVPKRKDTGIPSRRNVLRSACAVGAASSLLTALASAEQTGDGLTPTSEVDEDAMRSIYRSPEVQQLQQKYSNVDLKPKGVQSLFTDSDHNVVAANISVADGDLMYVDVHDTVQATLAFDRRRHDVIADWPLETDGLIRATANEATFIRTATADELEQIVNDLGQTEIADSDDSDVYVVPENQSYFIQKFDHTARRIELLKVSPQITIADKSRMAYQIDKQRVYEADSQAISTAADGCNADRKTAVDIFLCLKQVETCALCSPSIVGGPQTAVACMLLVCIGSYGAVEAIVDELNTGCTALVSDVLSCWDKWTDFY